jgi:hypothetical protein
VCNEVGNKYLGAIKYGEFYDKLGNYTCGKGIRSTELVDYLVSHNFVFSAFCLDYVIRAFNSSHRVSTLMTEMQEAPTVVFSRTV